ncbi:PfkB family carbohydrate kinase [Chloroflexota bacterium]
MSISPISDKIRTLVELSNLVESLKTEGKVIVLCHGVFDLLHPGHIRHFQAAKREGDILIVTVTSDKYVGKGPGRPVFNQKLRSEAIASLQFVDYVAVNQWSKATETIKILKPNVYVKGSDYTKREDDLTQGIYDEEEAIKSVGGRIHFTDEITFSSTRLLNLHFDVYPENAQAFLERFRKDHSAEEIISFLRNLYALRVLVIGDTIIDEYHYCEAMGKSPKGTVIATKYLEEERFAGGVLAVANQVASFCENVNLVTCLGEDRSSEKFIINKLKSNVTHKLFHRTDAPTVVKRRFVQPFSLSKMFEVCFIDDRPLPQSITQDVCNHLEAIIKDYDLVIVADFGHGFIQENIISLLCKKAKFLAVNTQSNSANAGFNFITKYPKADYVCIDEPEARFATLDKFGRIEEVATNIAGQLHCNRIAITHGQCDTLVYSPEGDFLKIPVMSREVVDTIGAGDSFLSVTAPCVASGYPMEIAGFIGNVVGALAVRIVCNRASVEPTPLYTFIKALLG